MDRHVRHFDLDNFDGILTVLMITTMTVAMGAAVFGF